MIKTVKRRWTNKNGQVVEKTYQYESSIYKKQSDKKSSNLVYTKSGKLKKTKVLEIFNTLLEKGKVTKFTGIADITRKIENMRITSKSKVLGNISAETVIASYMKDSLLKMLANTGYSVEQLANKLGVSVAELLDRDNWTSVNGQQYFKKPGGDEYRFEYKYDDEVFVKNVA